MSKKEYRLNVQGLGIKEQRLVGCIKSGSGKLFVAEDLISAEPMITSLLSGCPFYTYATYGGIGQKPFWNQGVLMVNDLYLMYASVNPVTSAKVKELFDPEEWLKDPDAVKKKLKFERSLCKVVCLSSAYGVGKDKLLLIFRENGVILTRQQVSDAYDAYWSLFSKIKATITKLSRKLESQGYLINFFGYKVCPPKSKDAFNAVNQSSVSGLMNYFMQKKFEKGAHLEHRFITVIHDCLITELPEGNIDATLAVTAEVLKEINAELGWSIPVRTDFHAANNFYGLK